MLREVLLDEFFEKQPDLKFVEDLKRYEISKIKFRLAREGEICPKTIRLDGGDFTGEVLLETVFEDFNEFLSVNGRKGKDYAVHLVQNPEYGKEEFAIVIGENGCIIEAGEREGVRRALIRFEDDMLTFGGNLKLGRVHEKMIVERRISRCFFSPINRPPKNGEELFDEVDYYPEGYLRRLMHDGVNMVWIYADMDHLVKSAYFKEFGVGSEKRIAKLNRVIEKCARYGVQVFIFTITPMSLYEPTMDRKYPGIAARYPQAHGNPGGGPKAFCTYHKFGEDYLTEAVEGLFRSAPKLAGMMCITQGERVSSCANAWSNSAGVWTNTCPYCSDKTQAEIVSHTVDIICKAMKRVNPNAEFISWTYGHRGFSFEKIGEYVDKVSAEAIMMQNFEDNGRVMQLGKKRFAFDYYLCYAGPSEMFEFTAERAKANGKRLYAKMQVCCSHELATVPYIPAPGIIYDKMTGAKRLGVTGVMESWFFGSYPCLMSKAVEMLSYKSDYPNKRAFLEKLASLYYGEEEVAKAADAWEYFEKGYTNYPVNVMFNYYGPMHDGIVWELALLPKNFSQPRTWLLLDKPDGDRIGEALFYGHTLDEAITLCAEMCKAWKKGVEILSALPEGKGNEEQLSVAKAIGLLIESGTNILRFYKLRNDLGYGRGDGNEIFAQMYSIAQEEIEHSRRMIELCEQDNRLGYHSEAEGYKFFPEKLQSRIASLERLLKEEFSIVEKRLAQGLSPLAYYDGEEDGIAKVRAGRGSLATAEWAMLDDGKSKFRVAEEEKDIAIEIYSDSEDNFYVCNEFELFFPKMTTIFYRDGTVAFHRDARSHQSINDERREEELAKWRVENLSVAGNTHLIVRTEKKAAGFLRLPYRMMVRSFCGGNWQKDPSPVRVLGKCTTSPADFGWLL